MNVRFILFHRPPRCITRRRVTRARKAPERCLQDPVQVAKGLTVVPGEHREEPTMPSMRRHGLAGKKGCSQTWGDGHGWSP